MVPPALMMGRKPDNCGEGRVAFISRDDCVACAAEVLLQPGHENRAYDLTGPELFTIGEALQMASELAGKPIVLEHVDDAGMFAYFDSLGVPRHASDIVPAGPIPWSSEDMVTFGRSIREGFFAIKSDSVERLTGRKPISLKEIMLRHRASWPK
jgi:NAD(P)H dehydrogenase (quinone)